MSGPRSLAALFACGLMRNTIKQALSTSTVKRSIPRSTLVECCGAASVECVCEYDTEDSYAAPGFVTLEWEDTELMQTRVIPMGKLWLVNLD